MHPEHGVDAAGEEAAQGLVGQHRVGQRVRVRRKGVARRQVLPEQRHQVGQEQLGPGHLAAGQRQLEAELGQPVRPGDVGQGPVPGQRAEWCGEGRGQAGGQLLGGERARRQPVQHRLPGLPELDVQVGGLRVDRLEDRVHGNPELGTGGQVGHRRRQRAIGGYAPGACRRAFVGLTGTPTSSSSRAGSGSLATPGTGGSLPCAAAVRPE